MSLLVLKITAMITMVIDHIGLKFLGDMTLMRFFGRTAFILYAFMAAESCLQTEKKRTAVRHLIRLAILALISEIPYDLFTSGTFFDLHKNNVIFTLFAGCAACLIAEHLILKKRSSALLRLVLAAAGILLIAAGGFLLSHFHASYTYVGMLMVLSFYLARRFGLHKKKQALYLLILLAVVVLYILYYTVFTYLKRDNAAEFIPYAFKKRTWLQLGSFIVLPFLYLYNGRKGTENMVFKWCYRLFYPAHLLLMYFLLNTVS